MADIKKIKVTYDYDDVLTGLNDYCIKALGLDSSLITRFEINKSLLSEEDKKRLLETYYNVETYKKDKWYKGIEDTVKISKDPRVDFKIHSHIITKEIGDCKEKRLLDMGFDKKCIYLQYGKEKKMEDTDIMVEDRVLNLELSPSKYKILINQPWNQEINHPEFSEVFKNIARVNDLEHANRLVEDIIEKWNIEQYNWQQN